MKDKTILISGASSGIGLACARLCAKAGARLVLIARRADKLEEISEALRKQYHSKILTLTIDVRDRDQVLLLDQLEDPFATIDVLINNAGLASGMDMIAESELDDWDRMIDTNLKGLLYVTRTILPRMIKRNSGHIVNIASTAGHIVYPGGSVYCATKHAVRAIAKTLQLELMDSDIRVSSVDPGMVETDFSMVRFKGDTAKAKSVYQGVEPLTADDVADAVLYCITRPRHVMIGEIVMYATAQGDGRTVSRKER